MKFSYDNKGIPIEIEFPLRGEWQTPTTPVSKVPSHGTNRFGLRYALDFQQVNWNKRNNPFYEASFLRYFFLGVPLSKCYCWGEAIYAPCDGEIITVKNNYRERKIVHWLRDSLIAIKNASFFDPKKNGFSPIGGNYVVMKYTEDIYVAFAHLQKDSILVNEKQKVKKGDKIGQVGHSGNSTAPHLHFQLMDRSDLLFAKGLPFVFEQYEIFEDGEWKKVYHSIPSTKDQIRFLK